MCTLKMREWNTTCVAQCVLKVHTCTRISLIDSQQVEIVIFILGKKSSTAVQYVIIEYTVAMYVPMYQCSVG